MRPQLLSDPLSSVTHVVPGWSEEEFVIIDCDSCEVRGLACGDCVVTALLGSPPSGVEFDEGECAALDVLAGSGLVPPLRLVTAVDAPADPEHAEVAAARDGAIVHTSKRPPQIGGEHSVAAG